MFGKKERTMIFMARSTKSYEERMLQLEKKEQDVKLNALVTVVNALKASKQMKAFGEFFNNQIEYATTVILSRSQNATPEQLEFCVNKIQELNPKAAIITTDWAKLSGEQILKVMEGQDNLEMKALAEAHHAKEEAEHEHEHHDDFNTGSVEGTITDAVTGDGT